MSETIEILGEKARAGWKDSRQIRQVYGIPPFYKLEENLRSAEHPYPNCIVHEAEAEKYDHVGGTNLLAVGEKGSGKSTLGLEISTHLMDVNDECVVWRGSPDRSEWLPLKPWTVLYLPANAEVTPTWRPTDMRADNGGEAAALEEIVKEVVYYDDLQDLLQQFDRHEFAVVYPDPTFSGCNEVMEQSGYCPHEVEYITPSAAEHDEQLKPTPLVHWWFAFNVARLEYGPYDWMSLMFDEAADLAPESARADKAQTYEKVMSLRRVMADSRKYFFSLFFFAHHEENVHSAIRRTIQWRCSMPDGTANPCRDNNDSPPVGYSAIPMKFDMLSGQDVGRGIVWTETNFTRFSWDDFPDPPEDTSRWLKIKLRDGNLNSAASARVPARATESAVTGRGVSDD